MAAVPFTATLIFKGPKTIHMRCTISDVNGQYWTFPDGNTFLSLPSDGNYNLSDVIVVTGGTDTTQSQLFVNGLNTGLVIDHKSNLNTANFRQFIQSPVTLKAGALIRITQAT